MTKILNLAMMSTPTIGSGDITLGAPVNSFLSFAQAGAQNGDEITYALEDGANREVGRGIYNNGTLTRTVLNSTNANAPINLSGNATIASVAAAEDFAEGGGGGDFLPLSGGALTGALTFADSGSPITFHNDNGYLAIDGPGRAELWAKQLAWFDGGINAANRFMLGSGTVVFYLNNPEDPGTFELNSLQTTEPQSTQIRFEGRVWNDSGWLRIGPTTKEFASADALAGYLALTGGTITGDLDIINDLNVGGTLTFPTTTNPLTMNASDVGFGPTLTINGGVAINGNSTIGTPSTYVTINNLQIVGSSGLSISGPLNVTVGSFYFSVGSGGVNMNTLRTSDPNNSGQLWNSNGQIVLSGFQERYLPLTGGTLTNNAQIIFPANGSGALNMQGGSIINAAGMNVLGNVNSATSFIAPNVHIDAVNIMRDTAQRWLIASDPGNYNLSLYRYPGGVFTPGGLSINFNTGAVSIANDLSVGGQFNMTGNAVFGAALTVSQMQATNVTATGVISAPFINFSGNMQMVAGSSVYFAHLPTTDPAEAGRLWNDSGTLKVSAG